MSTSDLLLSCLLLITFGGGIGCYLLYLLLPKGRRWLQLTAPAVLIVLIGLFVYQAIYVGKYRAQNDDWTALVGSFDGTTVQSVRFTYSGGLDKDPVKAIEYLVTDRLASAAPIRTANTAPDDACGIAFAISAAPESRMYRIAQALQDVFDCRQIVIEAPGTTVRYHLT